MWYYNLQNNSTNTETRKEVTFNHHYIITRCKSKYFNSNVMNVTKSKTCPQENEDERKFIRFVLWQLFGVSWDGITRRKQHKKSCTMK